MSDEYGDYAGDDQNTIRLMMEQCFNCDDEWTDVPIRDWVVNDSGQWSTTGPIIREPCEDRGHERLLTEHDLQWAVCGTCHGKGKSSLYLGSFTGEQLWEDPEFAEEYMEGRYDRACPECGGRTTVRAIRDDATHRDVIDAWFKDMHDMRAEEAAERRMGA